jgi:hypothetical protein
MMRWMSAVRDCCCRAAKTTTGRPLGLPFPPTTGRLLLGAAVVVAAVVAGERSD